MNAIILCGGLSTRLGDITKTVPKILLEIGNKTVLEWQLENIKTLGINTVVLAAGHLSDVLQGRIGTEKNGVNIIYAIEDKKLGTGGAIKNALKHVPSPEEPSFILNGDILTTVNFKNMASLLKPDSDGIILGSKVPNAASYGTLEYNEQYHLQAFKEKEGIDQPGFINGGLYLFTPNIHNYFPDKDTFSVEYDVFPNMKNLYVYESDRPWIDIGVPDRLDWARNNWQTFA